jgi:homoserine dehydrogenase
MRTLTIGLLGCGTVGRGFVELLDAERSRIRARYGLELHVTRILVRDLSRERAGVAAELLTTAPLDVVDGDCDVVVELIGGTHTAGTLVRRAIASGRHVVTANKALLAAAGAELFDDAVRRGVEIGFEASVCGGVPVIGALRRGFSGDSIESIRGVLNGTSNYVLCRMDEGLSLADAVSCAQELGFAEADPTLDLSGEDAAQKLAILAQLAFGEGVRRASVSGIASLRTADLRRARRNGEVIRLVAEARRVPGGVELEVGPRRLPAGDPLATVRDEQNAVIIRGRAIGEVTLSGRGAGSLPTAAAVMSDVIAIGISSRAGARLVA